MASHALGTRQVIVVAASGAVVSPAAFAPSTSSSGAVACRRTTASIPQWRRSVSSCSVSKGGGIALTSKFSGAVVPVAPVSSCRGRRYGSWNSILSPRSALVQKVTANELDSILTNERTSPMIIDFYATWCGPCVVLAQQLELLAVEFGDDVRFLKVDTDEEHELASQMEIRGLPTLVFVSKDVDKLAIRTEGLLPTTTIREIIENEILV